MRVRWNCWWRLLGPGLLVAVLWRVGPAQCWSVIRCTDGLWFAAACGLVIPVIVAKGWRWQRIVRAQGIGLSLRESVGQYAAGMLAGAVTPGKVGDLVKVPFLVSRGATTGTSVAASLLDRVLDAGALILLGIGSVLLMPGPRSQAVVVGLVVGLAVCVAATVAVVWSPTLANRAGRRSAVSLLTEKIAPWYETFRQAIRAVGPRWWPSLGIATVAAWIPYYGAVCCCAKAIGLDIAITDLVASVSLAAVLAMLPVTVAGVGTRDATFVVLLGRQSVSAEAAIALSSLVLAWMVVNCGAFYVLSLLYLRDPPGRRGTRNGRRT